MSANELPQAFLVAVSALGDRYDGLEDAARAVEQRVREHPTLAQAKFSETDHVTVGSAVEELITLVEELGHHVFRLDNDPIGDPETAP